MPHYDVEKIVKDLGLSVTGGNDQEIYALCPLHGDSSPSFNINKKTGKWICFSGCGGSSDIVVLIMKTQNMTYLKASLAVAKGYLKQVTTTDLLGELTGVGEHREKKKKFDTAMFENFSQSYPRWFIERGFGPDDINRFNLLGDPRNGSVIIPCYDENNTCLGYITRVAPSHASSLGYKYVLSEGLEKTNFLFGFQLVKRNFSMYNDPNRVWLCEGALDCIWLQKWGIPAVSLLGLTLAPKGIEILLRNGVEEVVLAMDNDKREPHEKSHVKKGREATQDLIKQLHTKFKLYNFVYPQREKPPKDPQELTQQEIINSPLTRIRMEI